LVADQVDAGDLAQAAKQRQRPPAQDSHAHPRGTRECLQSPALEEGVEPPGRVEELERVARGRRVEDEQVEAALLVELVKLGDRGQFLRAGHRGRELPIDAVGLDLLRPTGIWGDPLDQLVERPLGVEHHGPQLALDLEFAGVQPGRLDPTRLVLERLEAERVGQPVRRVDRHDRDLGPLGGHAERDRRRRRGLAHPARARAHAHALALEHLGDVHETPSGSPTAVSSASAMSSSSGCPR
jgi:hypothetical protein